jgi:hypothetical protein
VVIFVKKIVFLAAVLASAVLAPGALAEPAPPNVYCLNGVTTSLPTDVPTADGSGSYTLSQSQAESILADPSLYPGGVFLVGYIVFEPTVILIAPPVAASLMLDESVNTIAGGACTGGGGESADRQFFVCTGDGEPTTASRAEAYAGIENDDWFWPYAVPASAGLSQTVLGDWALTCSLPAGWVKGDLAVSTGIGGGAFGGSLGASLLETNPGDYVPGYAAPSK